MNVRIKTNKNKQKLILHSSDKTPHYGFRKLGIGLASMLLSTSLFLGGHTTQAHADTTDDSDQASQDSAVSDADDLARPQTQTVSDSANVESSSSSSAQAQPQAQTSASQSQTVSNNSNYAQSAPAQSQQAQTPVQNTQQASAIDQNANNVASSSSNQATQTQAQTPAVNNSVGQDQAVQAQYDQSKNYSANYDQANTNQNAEYSTYDATQSANYRAPIINSQIVGNANGQAQDDSSQAQKQAQKAFDKTVSESANYKTDQKTENAIDPEVNKLSANVQSLTSNIAKSNVDLGQASVKNKQEVKANDREANSSASFNGDPDDDGITTETLANIHERAMEMAAMPSYASLFTNLAVVNDDPPYVDEVPAGTVHYVYASNGVDGNYPNPVPGGEAIDKSRMWVSTQIVITVKESEDPNATESNFQNSATTIGTETKTISFGCTAYIDANGKILGYSNPLTTDYGLNSTDPNAVKIGGESLSSIVDGRNLTGYKIAPWSIDHIKQLMVHPNDPNMNYEIDLIPTPVSATEKIQYVDIDDNNKVLQTDSVSGFDGEKITKGMYNWDNTLKTFTDQGYRVAENPFVSEPDDQKISVDSDTITINLTHGTKRITPKDPTNTKTGKPEETTRHMTRTINYVVPAEYNDQKPKNITQPVTFTREGNEDLVTGNVTWDATGWQSTDPNWREVVSPDINGLKPDKASIQYHRVTPDDKDDTETVAYTYADTSKTITRTIHYVDPNGNAIPNQKDVTQPITIHRNSDGTWQNGTWPEQKNPVIDGYVTKNPTTPAASGYQDTTTNVVYTPVSKIVPVDPTGKEIPNAPQPSYKNDPNDPTKVVPDEDIPTVPGYHPNNPNQKVTPQDPTQPTHVTYTPDDKTKTVTRTIHYVDPSGKPIPNRPDDKQPVTLHTDGGNDFKPGTYDAHKNPVIPGYVTDQPTVPSAPATQDTTTTVTYTPISNIVPVDPSGKPIPNVPNPKYTNDPNDPTKVQPDEKVPDVPGYTPKQSTVTPQDPTKPTNVTYTPNDKTKEITRTIHFVDQNGNQLPNQPDVPQTITLHTNGGDDWVPGTYPEYKNPVIDGYVTKNPTVPATQGTDNTTVNVVYTKVGNIVPTDPNGKPIPDAQKPYKNDPTDPTKVVPNEDVPTVPGYTPREKNITPQDPTKDTPVTYDPANNATSRDLTVIVEYSYSDPQNQHAQALPQNKTTTLHQTGTKDANGNPNGDWSPSVSQAVKVEIPPIQGYEGTITGQSSNGNTTTIHVVYSPSQRATVGIHVNYIDEDAGNKILKTENPTGKVGEKMYDPASVIKSFTDQGYVLDKNNVPTGNYKLSDNGQTYTVTLKHGTQNVHGDVPNPSPNPAVHGKMTTGLTKTVPVTTKYSYDEIGGKQALPDKNQTITYKADGVIDLVTGAVKRTGDFTTTDKVDETIPDIKGYTGTLAKVDGNISDPNITSVTRYVVYKQNAQDVGIKINYIDEDNNNQVLKTETPSGKSGTAVYNPADTIKSFTDKGYVLDKNNVPTGNYDPKQNGQIYTVTFKHGTTKVHGDVPNPSPNPAVHGKMTQGLTKEVPVTTKYSYDEIGGKQALPDKTQTLTYKADGVIDMVTGAVKRTGDFTTTDTIDGTIPDIKGYTGNLAKTDGDVNDPNVKSITRYVVYKQNAVNSTNTKITFVDDKTGKTIEAKNFNGKPGDSTGYNTTNDIADLIKKGYKVVNDETKGQTLTFDNQDRNYTVTLGHQTENVTRKKTITRRIRYVVPNGSTAPKTVTQTLTFEDKGVKDMVTGQTIWDSDKNPETQTFDAVNSPDVPGSTPNKKTVEAENVTLSSKNWDSMLDQDIIVTYVANKEDNTHGQPEKAPDDYKPENNKNANPREKAVPDKKANSNRGNGNGENGTDNANNGNNNNSSGNNGEKGNPQITNATNDNLAKAPSATVQAATVSNDNGNSNAKMSNSKALPQTGEEPNSLALIAIGALLTGMSAIGLYESKRKRNA